MVQGFLGTLTVEERVLLHLHERPLRESEYEADPSLTQSGISDAVHVARKHLPRTLQKLLSRAAVVEHMRHVPGARQRRRVYGLSPEGHEEAASLRRTLMPMQVHMGDGSATLEGLLREHSGMLDLLDHVDDMLHYDDRIRQNEVSEEEYVAGAQGVDSHGAEESYRALARTAWQDGVISEDERNLLHTLSMTLRLDVATVDRIESEVRAERTRNDQIDREQIFLDMLERMAPDGGDLDEDEQRMIAGLAVSLRLDSATSNRLLDQWQGASESLSDFDDRLRGYAAAVAQAWEDGLITSDEAAILQKLRDAHGIRDAEHLRVMRVVRGSVK